MSFSNQLIDQYKNKFGIATDAEAAELIPEMNKGNLSKIRKGIEGRNLNEAQALWIAQHCALDCAQVLVQLAAEKSKSETAKAVWHDLAKKLKAMAVTAAIALILILSTGSGLNQPQTRKNNIP